MVGKEESHVKPAGRRSSVISGAEVPAFTKAEYRHQINHNYEKTKAGEYLRDSLYSSLIYAVIILFTMRM